jgi:predicted RNA-binding protein associated with RNAse of E/G family
LIRRHPGNSVSQITVLKLDLSGKITWQYAGTLVTRRRHTLRLEAFFDVGQVPIADVVLNRGDRFVETFFDDRMYNVFQVFDHLDHKLKGWYCNLSRPAVLDSTSVAWVDLALDLWVSPDGRQTVLDREEFAALPITTLERQLAVFALSELQDRFKRLRLPR